MLIYECVWYDGYHPMDKLTPFQILDKAFGISLSATKHGKGMN